MLKRLDEFIKNQGITVVELERKISASEGVIRKSIRNNTDIQAKWLVKIAENYPILNMNWLLTGEGDMLKDDAGQTIVGDNNIQVGNNNSISGNNQLAKLEAQITTLKIQLQEKDALISTLHSQTSAKDAQIDKLLSIIDNNKK